MKEGIHPESYRLVVFRDVAANTSWLCRSTVRAERTTKWEDGNEYPLYDLPVSRYSHPFFTGDHRLVDTEGRVEKFKKKYARK